MDNQETTQNPTPEGGASTLDRLERYLAAQDAPDTTQAEPAKVETAEGAADKQVEPEGDGQQSTEPQLSTSDLAKMLGLDDGAIDLDEDGGVKIKTKIDGKEGAAKLQDLIKSYQLQEHVDKKSREAAEREKALQARAQEAEQQFTQRLQYAENLTNIAANQLLAEFQSIDWPSLERQDAGQAALLRQKFQERQNQLRGAYHSIEQEKANGRQKADMERTQALQREAQRLPELIPEWKDPQIAEKERSEIRAWAIKAGYEPDEIDNVSKAHHVAVLRKAMLADRLQASKPEIENKVRTAPKLVKPGQSTQETGKDQELRSLKQAVTKTGGKGGSLEAYLLAKGLA